MSDLEFAKMTKSCCDFCEGFEKLSIDLTAPQADSYLAVHVPADPAAGIPEHCERITIGNLMGAFSDSVTGVSATGNPIATHTDVAGNAVIIRETITSISGKSVNNATKTIAFNYNSENGAQPCSFDLSGMFSAASYITCDGTTLTATDRIVTAPTRFASGFGTNQANANECLTRMDLFYNIGRRSLAGGDNYLGNEAQGYGSIVGNGLRNETTARGSYGGVFTGTDNEVDGSRSFIGAGANNTITGSYSAIAAGIRNSSAGAYHFIGGGNTNVHTASSYSAIVGGLRNTNSSAYNVIGGYLQNVTSFGNLSVGYRNTVAGNRSAVWGDLNNLRAGAFNTVGGYSHDIRGQGNTVLGYNHSQLNNANYNSMLGLSHTNTNGSYNGSMGYRSINTAGNGNMMLGYLNTNSAGSYNTLTGYGNRNRTGSHNVALGYSHDITGTGNALFGYNNRANTNYSVSIGRNINNTTQDGIMIANSFQRLGFYGVPPVPRQNLPVVATLAQIQAALTNLGLIV